ncbi:PD40 domain-containing protein [Roseivirga sp. E12]|uniref:PD40 domain-containing protein n=1 Tax=Roseivirga sp. E12 TaxID=2819237 RepID=UPI001ABCD378|nr:PD40 domain-containing protein [Roseivirga sp. E12]MBO3697788.1 PD40 domain-containing protein [Roseivirga sp. E12]
MSQKFICLCCISLFCATTLAQKPPLVEPAYQDVLSGFPNLRDFTISQNEDEAYFTALSPSGELSFIVRIDKHNNTWTKEIASFSGQYTDLEPFLSADGLKLFYASNRPKTVGAPTADMDIWYVTRTSKTSSWSKPINAGPKVNTTDSEFYPAITDSGNLYFTCSKTGSETHDDIYLAEWNGKDYDTPIALGDAVNSKGYEFNAYVSPDESIIIFSGFGRPDGIGLGDLYISQKNENGEWTRAKNLGSEINSDKLDYCPFLNVKTRTLYFTSRRSSVLLKKGGFDSVDSFLTEINKYENGQSRIYKTTLKW